MIDCQKLAELAFTHPPATEEEIQHIQYFFGTTLPKSYLEILRCSNGLELKIEQSYILYATSLIEERNFTYQVHLYSPHYIMIGDNGGGEGIFINKFPETDSEVLVVGMGAVAPDDASVLASNIPEWIANEMPFRVDKVEEYPRLADVYLVKPLRDGAKDLLQLKKALKLKTPITELYKTYQTLPCRLLHNVSFPYYAKLCAEFNKNDDYLVLYEVDDFSNPISIP